MARTIPDDWALRRDLEARHKSAVARKYEKIGMYEALITMWELDGRDPDYLRELRAKLRSAKTQLVAMKP